MKAVVSDLAIAIHTVLLIALFWPALPARANPYLAKPGEAPVTDYLSTCAVTGGFIHMYTALDQNIFEKYAIAVKHVVVRGGTNVNLAALGSDEVQFLFCAADSTIGAMAAGRDAVLIASPLVGLPYMIVARKDIRTVQDLRGKNIAIGTVAGLPFRLLTIFTKKFGLTDTEIRPIGGTQPERYAALLQGIVHSSAFTPPMDARAKKDGLNIVYHLNDLGLPSIYSSLHTNAKSLRERRQTVQRFVAALAEAVQFVEANPDKAKASVAKALRVNDDAVLQSSYDAYAKRHVNRRLIVPLNAVSDSIDLARESGIKTTKKANEIVDNGFAENLEKSGFVKELWGGKIP